jgi:hypothetical protein
MLGQAHGTHAPALQYWSSGHVPVAHRHANVPPRSAQVGDALGQAHGLHAPAWQYWSAGQVPVLHTQTPAWHSGVGPEHATHSRPQ